MPRSSPAKRLLTTRLPESRCAWCHRKLNAATGTERGARPRVGDWTVCITCGGLNRFTEKLTLRRASATELATADADVRATVERLRAIFRDTEKLPEFVRRMQ